MSFCNETVTSELSNYLVILELNLSIAQSFYSVRENASVAFVSVTMEGTTDVIVTGRYNYILVK